MERDLLRERLQRALDYMRPLMKSGKYFVLGINQSLAESYILTRYNCMRSILAQLDKGVSLLDLRKKVEERIALYAKRDDQEGRLIKGAFEQVLSHIKEIQEEN